MVVCSECRRATEAWCSVGTGLWECFPGAPHRVWSGVQSKATRLLEPALLGRRKLLHAVIVHFSYVNIALIVHCQTCRLLELTGICSALAGLTER